MARGSVAWIMVVVGVTAFFVGALLLTVTDPVIQGLFASPMWSSTTTFGTDALQWAEWLWQYLSLFVLLGFLSLVWINSRREG